MKINIGSKNQNKINAIKKAVSDFTNWDGDYKTFDGDSKISEEPRSLEETITGAVNRAKGVFGNCKYSIGIEDGIMKVPYASSGHLNFCACVIYDGKNIHVGLSPSYEHPPKVAELLFEQGMGLNKAYYESGLTDKKNVGSFEGGIGVLTKKKITRSDYSMYATAMAIAHLLNT